MSGSRLYRAIKGLAEQGDRAAIGTALGLAGPGRYRVQVGGMVYEDVPAIGGASAFDGQAVAVLLSGETGRPLGMLGVVTP
jgi:hypothetical protein